MVIKTDLFSHLNEWFPKHHYGTWEKGQAKKSLFIQLVSLRAKHFVGFSSFLQVLPVLEESETIYIYIYMVFFLKQSQLKCHIHTKILKLQKITQSHTLL